MYLNEDVDSLVRYKEDVQGCTTLILKDPDATTEAYGIRTTDIVETQGRTNVLSSVAQDAGFHDDGNFWAMGADEVYEVSIEGRVSYAPTAPY